MNRLFLLCFFVFFLGKISAQSPTDALMMPKGQLCILGQYAQSSWDEYWEGSNKRSNSNLGTFTSQNVMLMANYGITDRLNVMAALPYIWTEASASYLQGQRGVQDLSVWLKYQPLDLGTSSGTFKIQLTGGVSTPMSKYVPDFTPFSIGTRSQSASLRGILNYTFNFGLYATAQGGHTWRGPMHLDRDSYLAHGTFYYTDEVPIPDVVDASARLGFIKPRFQTEFWVERFACRGGDDIRYNDAPFPTNQMSATAAGWFGKGFVTRQLALQVSASKVLDGRNVGESTTYTGGITYFFSVCKKKAEAPK